LPFRLYDLSSVTVSPQGRTAAHGERQPAERARDSSTLFRALLDRTSDSIHLIDPDSGRFLDVNETACRTLGYTRDELLQMTLVDLDPGLDPEAYRRIRDDLRGAGSLIVQRVHRRKNGFTFRVEIDLSWIEVERPYLIAVVRDVTERLRGDETLRRLRAILESEPECVKLLAEDGTLIEMNPAGLAMIEADSAADVIGHDVAGLVVPAERDAFRDFTRRVFAGQTGTTMFEIVGLRGTRRCMEMHATPLRDQDGRIIAALSVTRDITDRVRAEDTRKRLEDQLRQAQKMEAVGQLSGGIAHDFNNILTVILGNTALIEADRRLPPELLEPVREVLQSAERASSLTRQLMMLSRQQPIQPRDLDLNDIVRTMTRMLERILGEDVHLRFDLAPSPLRVHADPGMLDQVLLNLAVNARDAMPSGGQLTIETFAVEWQETIREGSFAGVRVIDTGSGMTPGVVPHVFEPFFTTKDVGKGTGLGLATVYSIIQQHNGWIDVESSLGSGSQFTFYLPRLGVEARSVPRPPDIQVVPGGRETILVVEDERSLRALVKNVLVQGGYTVLEAPSGTAALDVWSRHWNEIQLLLTDVVMPDGMSGLDLAKKLLRDRPELRVIYTSGYSAEIAAREIQLQDGLNFLSKPYRPPELLRTVRANLDA
jgi:two-component system, cell cycle sensor histidine kinase and response regulator CckA